MNTVLSLYVKIRGQFSKYVRTAQLFRTLLQWLVIYASSNETGFDCGIIISLVTKTCHVEVCCLELQSSKT